MLALKVITLLTLLFSSATGQSLPPHFTISTVAGNGTTGYSGDGGPATAASLNNPLGLALDAAGNLYFADFYNNRVRKVAPNGIITAYAGNGAYAFSGDGGPATKASLQEPQTVLADAAGNLYVGDYGNHVRKIAPNGTITTLAGNGNRGYSGDGGPATNASIDFPGDLALDAAGNLYISCGDDGSGLFSAIRKVTPGGIISTVAGNGTAGYSGDGGPATNATLRLPRGLAIDSAGNLFFADSVNNRIRRVSNGIITTVAGNGTSGMQEMADWLSTPNCLDRKTSALMPQGICTSRTSAMAVLESCCPTERSVAQRAMARLDLTVTAAQLPVPQWSLGD